MLFRSNGGLWGRGVGRDSQVPVSRLAGRVGGPPSSRGSRGPFGTSWGRNLRRRRLPKVKVRELNKSNPSVTKCQARRLGGTGSHLVGRPRCFLSWPCDEGGGGSGKEVKTKPRHPHSSRNAPHTAPGPARGADMLRELLVPSRARPAALRAGPETQPQRPNQGTRGRGRGCSASPRPRARPCVRVRASSPRGLGRPRG